MINNRIKILLFFLIVCCAALTQVCESKANDSNPCVTKKFHYEQIEKICNEGGQKAAREFMKSVVKKAKSSGKHVTCTSCHENTKNYDLKDNAVNDLKSFL